MNDRIRQILTDTKPCSIPWFKDQLGPLTDPLPDDAPNVVARYRDRSGLWHVVIDADYREAK